MLLKIYFIGLSYSPVSNDENNVNKKALNHFNRRWTELNVPIKLKPYVMSLDLIEVQINFLPRKVHNYVSTDTV